MKSWCSKTRAAQWSLSAPAQQLLIVCWSWSVGMKGNEMPCFCLSTRGLCCSRCCCFDSRRVSPTCCAATTTCSTRLCELPVCPLGFIFSLHRCYANCVCFVSFFGSFTTSLPNILLFPVSSTPPLCHLFYPWMSCRSSLNTPPNPTAPLSAGTLLCCGGLQKRSGQMVSDDFRALLISTGNSLVLLLLLLLMA